MRLLVSIDQLVNTILGGHPDETISSRVGKHALEGRRWAKLLCKAFRIVLLDRGHCREAIEWDENIRR